MSAFAKASARQSPLSSATRAKTGGKGIRTPGLLIANETLYQLSYTPEIFEEAPFKVQNSVCISMGAHPFCPPNDFRKVHFCPEKSIARDRSREQETIPHRRSGRANSCSYRLAMGWLWFFVTVQKHQCDALWSSGCLCSSTDCQSVALTELAFRPAIEDGPSELDVQRTGANVYTGGTNDH